MNIYHTIAETRAAITAARASAARAAGKTVGLVPTMGALHAGHYSLIEAARQRCDFVVVSLFVNPTQFSPGEDLAAYPRTLQADAAGCLAHGADLLFAPAVDEIYPDGPSGGLTTVSMTHLPDRLCGASRPGHFDGVCTVVAKLFNITTPDAAFFGAKDFQQAAIIQRMVRDLNMPVDIVVCPTVREPDGLAMSSRNVYLSAAERTQAPALHRALVAAAQAVAEGAAPADVIATMREILTRDAPAGEVEYIHLVDPATLTDVETTAAGGRAILAVRFGGTRLIDNAWLPPAERDAV
jgi:pantoate--beta-alanine ligase